MMTAKEENIVNIAMRAGELLKAGMIERDDVTGHAGLTEAIIEMAEEFEQKFKGVDWNGEVIPGGENLDYWEEIDRFAEQKLLEQYGLERSIAAQLGARDQGPGTREGVDEFINSSTDSESKEKGGLQVEQKPLQIKVVIEHGLVDAVLKDQDVPVKVEVVDLDRDYEDYDRLSDYRASLYADDSLKPCDYSVADFTDDEPPAVGNTQGEREEDPVRVYAVSVGGVKREVFAGDLDECKRFCKDHDWTFMDENEFEWDLEMEDSRDDLLPEDYFMALDYYSKKAGIDIENEFVRQHADELAYCFHNEMELIDFDWWTHYETVLGEKLSFDEYRYIDQEYDGDPMELQAGDPEVRIAKISLEQFREMRQVGLDSVIKNVERSKVDTEKNGFNRDDVRDREQI